MAEYNVLRAALASAAASWAASTRQMGAACVKAGAQIWATVNHQGIQSVFRCFGFVHHCQHYWLLAALQKADLL